MVRCGDAFQLRELAALRAVMTQAAAGEVGEALERERQADKHVVAATGWVQEAGQRWYSHLLSGLQPELGGAYAKQLVERQEDVVAARGKLADAEGERAASEDVWREARAAQRSVEKVARILDRKRLNRREEAVLAAAADRAIGRWRES